MSPKPPTFSEWFRAGLDDDEKVAVAAMEGTVPYLRGQPEDEEVALVANLPGDDERAHPLYLPPNPFLFCRYADLKEMLKGTNLTPLERKQVRAAMAALEKEYT